MPQVILADEQPKQERVKFSEVKMERNDRDPRVRSWIAEFKRTLRWKLDDFIPNAYEADCINLEADYAKWEAAVSSGQFRMNIVDYLVFQRNALHPGSTALDESIDVDFCRQLRSSSIRRDATAQHTVTLEKLRALRGDSDVIVKYSKQDANSNPVRAESTHDEDEENYISMESDGDNDDDSNYDDSASSDSSVASVEDYVQTRLPNGEYCMRPLSDFAEFFIAEANRLAQQQKTKTTEKAARRAFRAACRSFKENSFIQNCGSMTEEPLPAPEPKPTVSQSRKREAPPSTMLTSSAQRPAGRPPAHPRGASQEEQLTAKRAPATAKQQKTKAGQVPSKEAVCDTVLGDTTITAPTQSALRNGRVPIYQSTPFFKTFAASGASSAQTQLETTHMLRSRARVNPAAKRE